MGKHETLDRPLYESDFMRWTQEQASKLRDRAHNEIDWDNVAEEIESLGRSERYEIDSRLKVLLVHLLKWRFQPQGQSGSWKASIREQRQRIARRLRDSPSLKQYPAEVLAAEYELAMPHVADETGLPEETFSSQCPFTIEQVLDQDWLPEAAEQK